MKFMKAIHKWAHQNHALCSSSAAVKAFKKVLSGLNCTWNDPEDLQFHNGEWKTSMPIEWAPDWPIVSDSIGDDARLAREEQLTVSESLIDKLCDFARDAHGDEAAVMAGDISTDAHFCPEAGHALRDWCPDCGADACPATKHVLRIVLLSNNGVCMGWSANGIGHTIKKMTIIRAGAAKNWRKRRLAVGGHWPPSP